MNFIITKTLDNLSASLVIVCEGMGDVHLVNCLLQHHKVQSCQVGCPSTDSVQGMGKDKIAEYLEAIKAAAALSNVKLKGLLVMGDADVSNDDCFAAIAKALSDAGFPSPAQSYSLERFGQGDQEIRVGAYIIPRKGTNGTLEHLLLESIDGGKKACIDAFFGCVGVPADLTTNELAKMKMSSLAGASCRKNPWTSVAYMFSARGNPVSIEDECFRELGDFLKSFASPAPDLAPPIATAQPAK